MSGANVIVISFKLSSFSFKSKWLKGKEAWPALIKFIKFDNSLSSIQSSIKSICNLSKKISDQLKFLAEDFVSNIKKESEDFLLKQLSKTLVGIFVLRLNIKAVKNFQKSKIGKLLGKGLSLLEIMV